MLHMHFPILFKTADTFTDLVGLGVVDSSYLQCRVTFLVHCPHLYHLIVQNLKSNIGYRCSKEQYYSIYYISTYHMHAHTLHNSVCATIDSTYSVIQ